MAQATLFARQGKQYPHIVAEAAALHLFPELQHKVLMQWGRSISTTTWQLV